MNYEYKILRLKKDLDETIKLIQECEEAYSQASEITGKLLAMCAEKGITKVSIGNVDKSVPATVSWPFGVSGSVFTYSPKKNRDDGFPPIWRICDSLGISSGGGNSDQHQVKTDKVLDGVYHLRGGKWFKKQSDY